MEIIGGDEFDRGLHAALAARRLLASCKALLGRIEESRLAGPHRSTPLINSVRSHLEDLVIAEAYAAIALAEGRDAAADPLLGWALRDIDFSSDLSPRPFEYVPEESFDALEAAGVVTVGDLLGRTPPDLIAAGVDSHSIGTLRRRLDKVGLALARRDGPPPSSHPIRATPVARLLARLPRRIPAALEAAGIATVGDLLGRTAEDLLELHGMGPTLLDDLEEELRCHGLALAEWADPAEAI